MNYSTAIFLVRKDVRAVATSYEVDKDGKGVAPFTVYKTLDPELKAGDYVVIPTDTRHGMTIARVEEVDVEIDFDSPVQVKWLVGAVDRAAYDATLAAEGDVIATIKSAEKKRKQDELRDKLLADNPDLAAFETISAAPALAGPEG